MATRDASGCKKRECAEQNEEGEKDDLALVFWKIGIVNRCRRGGSEFVKWREWC